MPCTQSLWPFAHRAAFSRRVTRRPMRFGLIQAQEFAICSPARLRYGRDRRTQCPPAGMRVPCAFYDVFLLFLKAIPPLSLAAFVLLLLSVIASRFSLETRGTAERNSTKDELSFLLLSQSLFHLCQFHHPNYCGLNIVSLATLVSLCSPPLSLLSPLSFSFCGCVLHFMYL